MSHTPLDIRLFKFDFFNVSDIEVNYGIWYCSSIYTTGPSPSNSISESLAHRLAVGKCFAAGGYGQVVEAGDDAVGKVLRGSGGVLGNAEGEGGGAVCVVGVGEDLGFGVVAVYEVNDDGGG